MEYRLKNVDYKSLVLRYLICKYYIQFLFFWVYISLIFIVGCAMTHILCSRSLTPLLSFFTLTWLLFRVDLFYLLYFIMVVFYLCSLLPYSSPFFLLPSSYVPDVRDIESSPLGPKRRGKVVCVETLKPCKSSEETRDERIQRVDILYCWNIF